MGGTNAFEMDYAGFAGTMSILVVDPTDPLTPNNVIELNDPWQINVNWEVHGPNASLLGGDWFVRAYLDDRDGIAASSGPVNAVAIHVPVSSTPAFPVPRNYSTVINVPAGQIQEGLYELTVAIVYENTGQKFSVAGFSDGPTLQFYNQGP
jgi:hypothetical protein